MKTKTTHTPGPWTLEGSTIGPKGDYDASIMARDGMTYIGGIVGDDRHGVADQWDSAVPVAEAQANARLIAAAPTLLETAKAYLEVIHGDDSPEAIALRAAVAKAEGR